MLVQILYSSRALADLERLVEFASARGAEPASRAVQLITEAISFLEHHPFIGRPLRGTLRELVISHGRTGYVALYRVNLRRQRAEVLAIRHPLEAGFA